MIGGVGVFACLTYKGLLLWDLLLIEIIAGLSNYYCTLYSTLLYGTL